MGIDYRYQASLCVERARAELASGESHRLAYAALELRKAIEALTYDKAEAMKAEIPPEEYATWQPRRVMQLLLEIDPHADATSTISIGLETEPGKPAPVMRVMGNVEVFNLKLIKTHYDALGSWLHIPTLAQGSLTEADEMKLRQRCDVIIKEIERVLQARIYHCGIGMFSTCACGRCEKTIRRRVPSEMQDLEAQCFECRAPYTLRQLDDGRIQWHPSGSKIACPSDGCDATIFVWADEVRPGTWWTCAGCGHRIRIELGLTILANEEAAEVL